MNKQWEAYKRKHTGRKRQKTKNICLENRKSPTKQINWAEYEGDIFTLFEL